MTTNNPGILNDQWLLHEAFMQIPANITILKGPDHIIQFANPPVFEILKDESIIGKSVIEIFPELEEQGYLKLLDQVYNSGEPFTANELKAVVNIAGETREFYSNVSYSAIRNAEGKVIGILSFSYDVSEQVKARRAAEDISERLKHSYEDLEVKVKFRNLELEKENQRLKEIIKANESSGKV